MAMHTSSKKYDQRSPPSNCGVDGRFKLRSRMPNAVDLNATVSGVGSRIDHYHSVRRMNEAAKCRPPHPKPSEMVPVGFTSGRSVTIDSFFRILSYDENTSEDFARMCSKYGTDETARLISVMMHDLKSLRMNMNDEYVFQQMIHQEAIFRFKREFSMMEVRLQRNRKDMPVRVECLWNKVASLIIDDWMDVFDRKISSIVNCTSKMRDNLNNNDNNTDVGKLSEDDTKIAYDFHHAVTSICELLVNKINPSGTVTMGSIDERNLHRLANDAFAMYHTMREELWQKVADIVIDSGRDEIPPDAIAGYIHPETEDKAWKFYDTVSYITDTIVGISSKHGKCDRPMKMPPMFDLLQPDMTNDPKFWITWALRMYEDEEKKEDDMCAQMNSIQRKSAIESKCHSCADSCADRSTNMVGTNTKIIPDPFLQLEFRPFEHVIPQFILPKRWRHLTMFFSSIEQFKLDQIPPLFVEQISERIINALKVRIVRCKHICMLILECLLTIKLGHSWQFWLDLASSLAKCFYQCRHCTQFCDAVNMYSEECPYHRRKNNDGCKRSGREDNKKYTDYSASKIDCLQCENVKHHHKCFIQTLLNKALNNDNHSDSSSLKVYQYLFKAVTSCVGRPFPLLRFEWSEVDISRMYATFMSSDGVYHHDWKLYSPVIDFSRITPNIARQFFYEMEGIPFLFYQKQTKSYGYGYVDPKNRIAPSKELIDAMNIGAMCQYELVTYGLKFAVPLLYSFYNIRKQLYIEILDETLGEKYFDFTSDLIDMTVSFIGVDDYDDILGNRWKDRCCVRTCLLQLEESQGSSFVDQWQYFCNFEN